MIRKRTDRKTLYQLCGDKLQSITAYTESKSETRASGDYGKIHSYATYNTYKKQARYFCEWLKGRGIKLRNLEAARPYVNEWLQSQIDRGFSPFTIKTAAAAMAKIYDCHVQDWQATPPRKRAKIKRSREMVERDQHFSEVANSNLVEFCRSTGLRRNELKWLHGTQLLYQDGAYYIDLQGQSTTKGGRPRVVPIVGNIELVCNLMRAAGTGRVFPRPHSAADIHSYRADYAKRVYLLHARPVDELPLSERYHCRKDKAGIVYDRAAMRAASTALGHNRIDVIAQHYLYGLV